jgi:hypothetical protein
MNPTTSESPAPFRAFTTTLGVLNVCLIIAAPLMLIAAILFFVTSYVFNDSGNVPQTVAPLVHMLFFDALFAIILFIWQLRTRKHLFAMLPAARKSMLSLGIAYVAIAIIQIFELPILSVPLAAIGIWWIVVFTRPSTRAAFDPHQPPTGTLPPAA